MGLDIYLNFRNRGLKIKLNVLRAELSCINVYPGSKLGYNSV